jgi:RNA polymerase sigma-70 factor, ECF subfamily
MATQAAVATQTAVAPQFNESKLIRAGQRGDSQAVETLFRRYQRPLFQTALRVLGNTEDAEDALQDGLLSAYRNMKRFEGRSQFSTWLTRIVINAALMRRRSAKARPAVSLDEPPRDLGAIRSRRSESRASVCRNGIARDDQRKPRRAFTFAPHSVCAA